MSLSILVIKASLYIIRKIGFWFGMDTGCLKFQEVTYNILSAEGGVGEGYKE